MRRGRHKGQPLLWLRPLPLALVLFWFLGVEKREPDVAHCAGVSAGGRESWCFRLFCLISRVEGRGWGVLGEVKPLTRTPSEVGSVSWLVHRGSGGSDSAAGTQKCTSWPGWFLEGGGTHSGRIYLGWSEISSAHKCGLRSAEISQKGNLLTNLHTFQSQEKKCGKKKKGATGERKKKKPNGATM